MSYNPLPPQGQAASAASLPVVVASDQAAVPAGGSLLEELLIELRILVANLGGTFPDSSGRMRVLVDAITATVSLGAVSTVSTVSAVTNVAQEGGQPANTNVGSLMNIVAYNGLRQQIVTS